MPRSSFGFNALRRKVRASAWLIASAVALPVPFIVGGCGSGNGASSQTPTYVLPSASASASPTASPTPTSSASAITIGVTPSAATITVGGTVTFSATVSNSTNQAVTYAVTGGDAAGTITQAGVYTAPSTPGVYIVTVTSQADATKTASVQVTVEAAPVVGVSVNPVSATISTGQTVTLNASVVNTTNQAVTFSVTGGNANGTLVANGQSAVYTAPSIAGTYTVIVTSAADTTKTATSTITVQAQTSSGGQTGGGAITVN